MLQFDFPYCLVQLCPLKFNMESFLNKKYKIDRVDDGYEAYLEAIGTLLLYYCVLIQNNNSLIETIS